MEMWARLWTRNYFLVKKRHVGQVTNRGEASRTQNRDVGQVIVRRRKMGRFFEFVGQVVDMAHFFGQKETCWSGDKQGRSKQDAKKAMLVR